jgi:hypothetical protein
VHLQALTTPFYMGRFHEECCKLYRDLLVTAGMMEPQPKDQAGQFAHIPVFRSSLSLPPNILNAIAAGEVENIEVAEERWEYARRRGLARIESVENPAAVLLWVESVERAYAASDEQSMHAFAWWEKYTDEYWKKAQENGGLSAALAEAADDACRLIDLK